MAAIIATAQNYWISTSALTITLNALGEANRVQASVASGAQIMCYIRGVDGLDFDEGHNYRRWPLTVSPTYFNTNTHKYLYVVIPRTTAIGTQAMVWFPSQLLDVNGCAIDEEGEPAEQVGNPDYYYIWLQGIISSSGASGNTPRTWEQQPQTGTLATDEAVSPTGGFWYQWDAISQTVTFLKDIWMDAASTFRNLILGGKTLTGVATDDSTPGDSTTHVVTPAYLKTQYSNKYIRKDQDDSTPYNLGVEQSLNVGKDLAVDGDATIVGTTRANVVQSDNYTGDGVADTGYRLTKDDGTGSSKLTVDNLYVRKKATFEELEVRKETAIAGNQIYSSAANIILRTDYFDANGQLMGYSTIVVPYLLKRVPFLLRMLSRASRTGFFGRERRLRMFLEAEDIPKIRRVRCYFLAKDDDRTIDNLWQCNELGADLARCQTMNLHNSNRSTYIHGMETKLGNVYWWRKLCGVSSQPVTIDGDDREYHYFDVMFNYNAEQQYRQQGQQCPWADVASGDIPCAGDHVVQFGNDLNPDRMNLIAVEVNSSSDAPAHKWYRGIYTFDLSKCWWGGNPRKDMISAASGVEFYGPSFKVQTEYGIAKVPKDRDEVNWSDIAPQRDDYGEHPDVRKCYSYDAITHGGCRWLCLLPDGAHWVCPQQWDDDTYALFDANGNYRHNGNYITNTQYNALTTEQKQQCGRIPNYTTLEPGTQAADGVWKKIVDKGANSIRIDLDNENDTMLYSSTKGLVSGNVYSHASLMDGTTDVTAQATWAIVAAGCTATISGSTVTVTAMSAATGSVMVRATYNGQTYEKELTLKRIVDGDKFELIISPNSIAYNTTTDTPATSTLSIQVFKTACDGTRALSAPPSGYQVYANGTALTATATGTYSYTTDNSAISEVAVKIATTASSIDSLDAETIPINKAANGKSITKKSETYRYATNNTGTRPAASSSDWSTTKPTLQKGYWLYTETTITWSDDSTTVLYTDERNPNDGVAGQDIIVDGATVMKYYVGDSNTTHPADGSSDWKDLSQVTQTQGKWLWSQATTYYRKASSAAGSHDAGTSYNYNVSYISKDGKTGRGISSITEYYQATNSSAARTAPTSTTGWSTDPNLSDLTDKWDQNHKYLWNMERTIYSNVDGSTTTEYSIPQIVAIWTKDGAAGKGIDSIVNYYKITSTATAPSKPSTPGTDGWTTTPSSPAKGQYLWNYERITWINPAGTTETDVQMIGYAGTDGASITKASADTFRYAVGDSGINPPSSGWSTTKPSTFDKNKWLWTETTIHWSDGSTTTLYSAERNPNDGVNGQDIIVDGATVMKYYVGDSNTTHPADTSSDWKDLSQVTQTQGKWLWSQATTYYRKASSAAGSHDAGTSYNYNVSYISKDGKTGRGISSITEYYQATNSSAARTAPTSTTGWSTDPNLSDLTDKWDQNHKYLWNMERTIYANVDGTTTTTYSIPQIVAIWTKDGAAGRGIDSIVNYYKITSTSTAPSKPSTPGTDGWSTTPSSPAKGQYLWNYERITWVNPSGTTETDVQMIGYAGTDGASITKASADTFRYAIGDSGITPPSSGWSTTKPSTFDKNKWLWTETTIHWSDGSTTTLYSAERNPNDGVNGQDIIVDGATVMKYYVGDSNTTHPADTSSDWKDLSQVTQTQGKWLWSQATTNYRKALSAAGSHDAGTSYNYNVSYISKDGKTGRGISSITEYYQATNSSAARTAPDSATGWSTDPNLSDPNLDKWDKDHKYLWNMERTIYANVDGSTTTTYSIPQIVAIWTKDGSTGAAGRGIDSIVNYYKITSTNTAPSKPSTPGTDDWTTTPRALAAGEYLWNYERITWINPAGVTETDVQMIGYAGTNGQDSTVPGPPGDDGDDGWTIIANPANVILTQSLSTTSSFSTATVSFSAKKGSRTASFYLTGLTEGNFNCEKPSGTETIRVLSPKSNGSSYYTEGYFDITINATDPDTNSLVTFTIRVLCYANLLGTWKQSVEDGEERIAAQKISYALNNGDGSKTIEQSKNTFNSVRNSAESFQQWQNDTSGVAGTYQYINTHLSTAENNISKMDAKIPTKNLLDCASGDGWRNWYDDSDANYNNATQLIGSTASDANQIDVYSKPVFLKSGVQYVVSLYSHTSPTLKIYKLNGNPNAKVDDFNGNHAEVLTVYSTTTTYQGCTRYYAVFTLSSSYGNDDYVLDVFGSLKYFYRPMIEVGNSPTDWVPGSTNQTSEIRQTANEIEAKVNDTGVNINDGTINLYADKVRFFKNKASAAAGDPDKVWIDGGDGSLHAEGGGTIGGFEIGSTTLGKSSKVIESEDGWTYIRRDGRLNLRCNSATSGDYALQVNGSINFITNAYGQTINIDNNSGAVDINASTLNLNTAANNLDTVNIGSRTTKEVNIKAEKNINFGGDAPVSMGDLLVTGSLMAKGSIVTGGTSGAYTLPGNTTNPPEEGTVLFCKGLNRDLYITIPSGFKLLDGEDVQEHSSPYNCGRKSHIITYMGDRKWVIYYCG